MSRPTLLRAIPCPICGVGRGESCVKVDGSPLVKQHPGRTPEAPCGTPGGYQRHKKADEDACDPCREANRRYMAEYRNRRPEYREKDVDDLRARRRATRRLVAMHRADFDRLLADERTT